MNHGFGRHVVLAPDTSRHDATLPVDGDDAELIAAGAFDGCDIESQDVASLMSTLDVDCGVALMAVHTRPLISLANLAHFSIPCPWNQGDTLAGTEGLGVAKLDFGRPDCAGDVHPVVVRGPLQGFARVDRAAHLLLLLAVIVGRPVGVLPLEPLPLPLLFGLLLVRGRNLGRFDKVVLSMLDWAKSTLVMLCKG